jgi:hypothetical protein
MPKIGAVIAITKHSRLLLDGIMSIAKQVDRVAVLYSGGNDCDWDKIVGTVLNKPNFVGAIVTGTICDKPCICVKRDSANRSSLFNGGLQLFGEDYDYIVITDGGVVFRHDKVSLSIDALSKHEMASCVVSDFSVLYDNDVLIRHYEHPFDIIMMKDGVHPNINCVIRRRCMVPFNEELSTHDDYEWIGRVGMTGLVYHIPESLHTIAAMDRIIDQVTVDKIKDIIFSQYGLSNG